MGILLFEKVLQQGASVSKRPHLTSVLQMTEKLIHGGTAYRN